MHPTRSTAQRRRLDHGARRADGHGPAAQLHPPCAVAMGTGDLWKNDRPVDPQHPRGVTLLARDTPENRATWGADSLGYVDVADSVCADPDPEDGSGHKIRCPYYTYRADDPVVDAASAAKTPIHLLVASFRDRLCPRTLHNAWSRAEHPERVYIRLVDQTASTPDGTPQQTPDDVPCWEQYCADFNPRCREQFGGNVYVHHMDAAAARGPTDARSKLSAMVLHDYRSATTPLLRAVQPQDFCMQTDSHMDFSDHWDGGLIAMFHRTQNDYAVLSTYVADISENNHDPRVVPNLCMVTFGTGTIRNWGTKECRGLVTPKLTNALWGAGLSFHRCHAELTVPVDPYLTNVFDGEEGSRGLRFFTHGYDVYTPDRVLVTHDYKTHQSNPIVHTWGGKGAATGRSGNGTDEVPIFLREIEAARPRVSLVGPRRVNVLLGIGDAAEAADPEGVAHVRRSRYGLGNRRNLTQAQDFTGIDLRRQRMVANKCGNLQWVPFTPSTAGDYGVAEVLARDLAGDEVPVPADEVALKATVKAVPASDVNVPPERPYLRRPRMPPAPIFLDPAVVVGRSLGNLPVSETSALEFGFGGLIAIGVVMRLARGVKSRRRMKTRDE